MVCTMTALPESTELTESNNKDRFLFDPVEQVCEPDVVEVTLEPEAYIEEEVCYEEYYDEVYCEPVYSNSYSDNGFKSAGVVYGDDGTRYTWYSQNVLPGGGLTELNGNGRHVNDEGFVCDGDGYISVASSDYEIGTIVDTPFGIGKVYDTGCAPGTIDIYTDY